MNSLDSKKTDKEEKEENLAQFKSTEDKRGKIRKFFLYGKCFVPLLIAHHPECEVFGKSHTINIGKYGFCIGCFVGYTVAIISLIIFRYFINIFDIISPQWVLILSLIFIGSFVMSPLKLTKIKTIKIIQKALIGIGAIFLFLWIRNLPNPRATNTLIILIVFMILISILNLYHSLTIIGTCYKCKTPFDWGNCPGFKTISANMEKYNLFNFLIFLEDLSNQLLEKRELKKKPHK